MMQSMLLRVAAMLLPAAILCAEDADRKAAEWTLAQGGRVKIAGRANWVREKSELPAGDYAVETLDWLGVNADPPDLERLGGLRHLKALHLPGPFWNRNADSARDGSRDMKYLTGIATLEVLTFSDHFLDRIRFRDDGLDAIAALTGLRELRVRQANVRGAGLRHFINLESLDIELCPVGDQGFASLRGMTKLKRLWAGDTLVTDAGLAGIAGLSNLEELDLHGTAISDAGLEHLRGLKMLRRLNLMGASVTDAGIDVIAGMRGLEELNLYRTKVSNTGLARLHTLVTLEDLDVRYSRTTRAGVEAIRAALPRLRVQHAAAGARPEPPKGVDKLSATEWVKALGGRIEREAGEVVAVALEGSAAADGDLGKLAAFTKLRKLDLSATEVGDLGMQPVSRLAALSDLNLNGTSVGDAGVRLLVGMRELRALSLRNTYVEGDFDWPPSLERVDLNGSPAGNAAVGRLAKLASLKHLGLSSTDITDAAPLGDLTQIESLDLSATDLTNTGLKSLAGLSALRSLVLRDARFTDAGLESLTPLINLRQLDLARTRLSDKGMTSLGKLTGLTHLVLDYGEIYDAGFARLAPLTSLEILSLDSTHITDASVILLKKFTKLKSLNLYHTVITPEGHTALRSALPECRIVWDADSSRPTRRRS
jgi:Leucine-rich repeat (LRR) protein